MGAYLASPVTDTDTASAASRSGLQWAHCGMQGWRVSMEDAYLCETDVPAHQDTAAHFFGVFDGHGGADVAVYAARHMVEFVTSTPEWQEGKIGEALKAGFFKVDEMIANGKAAKELVEIAKATAAKDKEIQSKIDQKVNGGGEAENGQDDAVMSSVRDVIRLAYTGGWDAIGHGDDDEEEDDEDEEDEDGEEKEDGEGEEDDEEEGDEDEEEEEEEDDDEGEEEVQEDEINTEESGEQRKKSRKARHKHSKKSKKNKTEEVDLEIEELREELMVEEEDGTIRKATLDEIMWAVHGQHAAGEEGGDGDEDENKPVNSLHGYDSGCTAVVAVIHGNKLYVANVGDSRCVLNRDGTAVDMSEDHKPEDEKEMQRIRAAGGYVSGGRVDGNLNLSRALGDLTYKDNVDIPPSAQKICADADIEVCELTAADQYLIVACDGIWNSMTSQEVVDFVNPQLDTESDQVGVDICKSLCNKCLASHTSEEIGCDNMTVVFVKLSAAHQST